MTPTKTPTIRYSPRPREGYQRIINGTPYGPATSGLLETTEAWNLAFLSHDVDNVLHHPDPYFTTNVRRTIQTLLDGSGPDLASSFPIQNTIGILLRMPAPQFAYQISKHKLLKTLPMFLAYGPEWLTIIEERSHICCVDEWKPEAILDVSQALKVIAKIK